MSAPPASPTCFTIQINCWLGQNVQGEGPALDPSFANYRFIGREFSRLEQNGQEEGKVDCT